MQTIYFRYIFYDKLIQKFESSNYINIDISYLSKLKDYIYFIDENDNIQILSYFEKKDIKLFDYKNQINKNNFKYFIEID